MFRTSQLQRLVKDSQCGNISNSKLEMAITSVSSKSTTNPSITSDNANSSTPPSICSSRTRALLASMNKGKAPSPLTVSTALSYDRFVDTLDYLSTATSIRKGSGSGVDRLMDPTHKFAGPWRTKLSDFIIGKSTSYDLLLEEVKVSWCSYEYMCHVMWRHV